MPRQYWPGGSTGCRVKLMGATVTEGCVAAVRRVTLAGCVVSSRTAVPVTPESVCATPEQLKTPTTKFIWQSKVQKTC